MELKKANLHMDHVKCQINTQITLEEDKNISDRNPDADRILLEKGRVIIEEMRPAAESLYLKGKLNYEVLYSSDDDEGKLYRIQGEIPWEEKVRVEGMESTDTPQVTANIEDLRSNLINSRKVNIRGLVNFCISSREIKDNEVLLDVENLEQIEVKKEPYSQSVIVVDKKDIFRIKEDLELPASLPAIGEVIWKNLELGKWEIKPLEDAIGIQGEVHLFILYESAEEESQLKTYETIIPFSGNIECTGINSCMVADITPVIGYENLGVKPDYDGEDRVLDVEMVLEIPIRIYENRDMEQVTDIYGTSMEVVPEYSNRKCRRMRDKCQGRIKVNHNLKLPASSGKILQICHVTGRIVVEDSKIKNEGLEIEGILNMSVLYVTDSEYRKYEMLKKEIPFSYEMNHVTLCEKCKWKINPVIEQCQAVILDENNIEVKIVACMDLMVEEWGENLSVCNIRVKPFEEEVMNNSPGMVVYIPTQKENIWNVGKHYGISRESIREINQLSGDEIQKGQKILLVKNMCG